MKRVAILGGGVGGLSAAFELSERGFDVTVYEARKEFGGKARSIPVPKSGTDGRPDLPGEHGFRFFPGFYQHVTDTMKRIPYGDGNVFDNLTPCTEVLMAQAGGREEIVTPIGVPNSSEDVANALRTFRTMLFKVGIPPSEYAEFVLQILQFMTSCDERRLDEFEGKSWLEFVKAADKTRPKSPAYMKFLAEGMTRTLVAAKADKMSARTGGTVLCQLLYDMLQLDARLDNVLNGPTSEVWIDPWVAELERRGVTLRPECAVAGILCDDERITSVTIATAGGGTESIHADYYISAIPAEKVATLLASAAKLDERLGELHKLKTDWMTGIMFYLDKDVPLKHGHAIFIDSKWSLTAISQQQFWLDHPLEKRGNGKVKGVISIDVSAWDVPGNFNEKNAEACTAEEIKDEVWAQLTAHIDDKSFDGVEVLDWFLDPAIQFPNPGQATNAEPLLINTRCSWKYRPEATTKIPNLFLASDFVQTNTDLATMEGANEAARAAVNGILKASGSTAKPCMVEELQEPWVFWLARKADWIRWKAGLKPAKPPFRVTDEGDIVPTGLLAKPTFALLRRRQHPTFLTNK